MNSVVPMRNAWTMNALGAICPARLWMTMACVLLNAAAMLTVLVELHFAIPTESVLMDVFQPLTVMEPIWNVTYLGLLAQITVSTVVTPLMELEAASQGVTKNSTNVPLIIHSVMAPTTTVTVMAFKSSRRSN